MVAAVLIATAVPLHIGLRYQRQHAAAEAIERAGGGLGWYGRGPEWWPSQFCRGFHDDGDFCDRLLDFFSDVKSVEFSNAHVSEKELRLLSSLPALEELWLDGTPIGDAELVHLRSLTQLRVLSLTKTAAGETGLCHLSGLTHLEELFLDDTPVGKTEVTQRQWRAVMGTTPWKGQDFVRDGDDYPATYVSWDDAKTFCWKLSEMENEVYRLPTEAEWEYACRGESTAASTRETTIRD